MHDAASTNATPAQGCSPLSDVQAAGFVSGGAFWGSGAGGLRFASEAGRLDSWGCGRRAALQRKPTLNTTFV